MYGKVIVIKRDGEDGAMFPIQQKAVTMGRTGDCDIRIQRPSVSRFQCSLEVNDRFQLMLKNLSETNPTNINGKAVKDVSPVYHQDIIQIDDRYFRIEYPPGSVFALVPRSPASSAYSRQIAGRQDQEPEIISHTPQNQIKTVKKRKSENLLTKSPSTSLTAKKRISFAPGVSPEIFDKTLPASMPIKRGSVPASPVPTRARKSLLRTPNAQKFSPLHETNANRRSRSLSKSPMSAISKPLTESKISTPASEKIASASQLSSEKAKKASSILTVNEVGIENVSPKSSLTVDAQKKPLTPASNSSNKQPLSSVTNNMPLNAASPSLSRKILTARRSRVSTVATDSPDSSLDSITDFLTPEPSKQPRTSLPKNTAKPVDTSSTQTKTPVKTTADEKSMAKTTNAVTAVSPGTRKVFLARSSATPAPRNSLRVGLLKKTLPKTQVTPKGTPQVQKESDRKSILVRKSTLMGKTIASKNTPKAAPKTWADIAKKRLTPKLKKNGPVVTKFVKGKMKSTVRVKRPVRSFGTEMNDGKNYIFNHSSFASPTIIVGHPVQSKTGPKVARPLSVKGGTPKVIPIVKGTSKDDLKKQPSPKLISKSSGPVTTSVVKKSVTPSLSGVKKLMKSPKPSKSPNVIGVKELFNIKQVASPNVKYVRSLMRTPKEIKSPDVRGVKSLLRSPKQPKSPQVSGMKRLFKSPEGKSAKSPRLSGVAELMKSPEITHRSAPSSNQTKITEAKSPAVYGLKRLFSSPKRKGAKSPRLSGVAEIMKSPESPKAQAKTSEIKDAEQYKSKNVVEKSPPKPSSENYAPVPTSPRKTRGTRKQVESKTAVSPAKEQASPKKTRALRKAEDTNKAVSPKKTSEPPKSTVAKKAVSPKKPSEPPKSTVAKKAFSPKKPSEPPKSTVAKKSVSPKKPSEPPKSPVVKKSVSPKKPSGTKATAAKKAVPKKPSEKSPVRNAEKIAIEVLFTPKQTRSRGTAKAVTPQKPKSPKGETPSEIFSPVVATRTRTARKVDVRKAISPKKAVEKVVSPIRNVKSPELEAQSTPKKGKSRRALETADLGKSPKSKDVNEEISIENSPKKTRNTRITKQNINSSKPPKSVEANTDVISVENIVKDEKTPTSPKVTRNTRRRVQERVKTPSPEKVSKSPTPKKTRNAKEKKDVVQESSPKKLSKPETPKKTRSTRGNKAIDKIDVQAGKTQVPMEKQETPQKPPEINVKTKSSKASKKAPVVNKIDTIASPRKTRGQGKANEKPKHTAENSAPSKSANAEASQKRTRAAVPIEEIETSPKKPKIAAVQKDVQISPKKTRSAKGTTKIVTPVKETVIKEKGSGPKVTRSLRSRKQ